MNLGEGQGDKVKGHGSNHGMQHLRGRSCGTPRAKQWGAEDTQKGKGGVSLWDGSWYEYTIYTIKSIVNQF